MVAICVERSLFKLRVQGSNLGWIRTQQDGANEQLSKPGFVFSYDPQHGNLEYVPTFAESSTTGAEHRLQTADGYQLNTFKEVKFLHLLRITCRPSYTVNDLNREFNLRFSQ